MLDGSEGLCGGGVISGATNRGMLIWHGNNFSLKPIGSDICECFDYKKKTKNNMENMYQPVVVTLSFNAKMDLANFGV